ncbi:MAG: PAS domain S-box protein, partial [Gammaproteobacteria bacterium]|nr:PAS domain S-box protein [Gammaproteobacteria bacterium]
MPFKPSINVSGLGAGAVALIYAALAGLWIAVSDNLLGLIITNPVLFQQVSLGKGFIFVAVTAALLYLLLHYRTWAGNLPEKNTPRTITRLSRLRLLSIFIALSMVVPLVGSGIIHLHGPQIRQTAYEDLRAVADLQARQMGFWLNERRGDAETIAASSGLIDNFDAMLHGNEDARRRVYMKLDSLKRNYGYEIDLYDPAGHMVYSTFPHTESDDAKLQPYLKNALLSAQVLYSDLYRKDSGRIHFELVVPLRLNRAGNNPISIGNLLLHAPVDNFLSQLIDTWPASSASAETLLVYRDGNEYRRLRDTHHAPAFKTALAPIAPGRSGDNLLAAKDYRDIDVLAVIQPVTGTSWEIVAKINLDEVMTPLHDLALWISVAALFAVASLGAVILMLWRQQSRTHREELQSQAAEKDRVLRQFYDLSLFGMAIIRPDNNRANHVNDELCRITGYTHTEIVATDWTTLLHPDERAADTVAYQRLLKGETDTCSRDTRIVRKDGTVIDVTIVAQCVRDPGGKAEMIIATIRDVTERKAMEYALRESSDNLNRAQHIGQIGSWNLDIQGNILAWSSECYRIFGIPEGASLTYEIFLEHIHPEDRDYVNLKWNDALRGSPYDIEHRILVDGQVKWIRERAELRFDASGALISGIGTAQDITKRKNTETRLRENEAILTESQRIASLGHYVFDAGTTSWTSSVVLDEIFGINADYAKTTESWLALIHPEDRASMAAYFHDHVLRDGNTFDRVYRIVRARDSEIRWMHGLGRLEVDASGKPVRMLGTIQDITEQKQIETVLRENQERLRILEERFRVIFEGAMDGILLADPETGKFLMSNPSLNRMLGYESDEILNLGITDIHPKNELPRILEQFERSRRGEISTVMDVPLLHKDGSVTYADISSTPIHLDDQSYLLGIFRDATERRLNEDRLHLAAAVFDNTREGVVVADEHNRILMVNRAFCEITGYEEHEAIGKTTQLLKSGRHDRDFYITMWQQINAIGHWRGEIWNRRKNGEIYPEILSISAVRNNAGKVVQYVGVFTDISRIKASEEKLEFLAYHDALTQLPNRLLLLSRLEHSIDTARRNNRQFALLMLDLDRFKDVNDSFGHPAGDELLQQVAEHLAKKLRGSDTVARLGGDEFALLLENITHPQDASHIADEIIADLKKPWHLSNSAEVRIGASVGISLYPDHGQTAQDLLQQSDTALHLAKSKGRSCARYFSDSLTQTVRMRVELEARLRHALAQNELRVYFQPQIDIGSGRISGAEALVRWIDPVDGFIPPGRFIPIAEETGLIADIGEWVLEQTCHQGRRWMDLGLPPLTLSVNLAP